MRPNRPLRRTVQSGLWPVFSRPLIGGVGRLRLTRRERNLQMTEKLKREKYQRGAKVL